MPKFPTIGNFCSASSIDSVQSYQVEVQVNDEPIEGRVLMRSHSTALTDAASHAASVGCYLKKNDIVTLVVRIIKPDGRTYVVPKNTASLTIKRSRIYE